MVILNMDMPKCCGECDLCDDGYGCKVKGVDRGDRWHYEWKDKRIFDCPIIAEIPKDKPWVVITEDTIRYNDIVDVSEWDLPKWTEAIRSKRYD